MIDFDDAAQPCGFIFTVALREEYATQGVHFTGMTGPDDGGAILDECLGGWGVTGFSPPNVFAFNDLAVLMNGGIPRPPELISFDFPISEFQINAGVGFAVTGMVTIEARDSGGAVVDTSTITLASGMQTMSVSGADIRTIEMSSTAFAFALDDLAFVSSPVPAVPGVSLAVMAIVWVAWALWYGRRY